MSKFLHLCSYLTRFKFETLAQTLQIKHLEWKGYYEVLKLIKTSLGSAGVSTTEYHRTW